MLVKISNPAAVDLFHADGRNGRDEVTVAFVYSFMHGPYN
jgi:hypothetical protein